MFISTLPSTDHPEQDARDRQSPKKPEPRESNNWSDVSTYFYNPRKIFSLRQDLPKRLNFAYFWARTRIVQKGIMVRSELKAFISYHANKERNVFLKD
jgi:hypothetical protein